MMVTNSMPASSPSRSTAPGTISHARPEQGFSQVDLTSATQQGPITVPVTVTQHIAGFHLHSHITSTEADTVTVADDLVPSELIKEERFEETVLGTSTPANLATQAQTLIQGISKAASKQAETNQITHASLSSPSQGTNSSTSVHANPILTSHTQENQNGVQASALSSLKVPSADLQMLLNQPVQGQALAANAQSQTPITQHSNPTSPLAVTQTQGAEWAAVRVDTSSGKWGEQMMQVLQDRVTLQAQQNLSLIHI